MQIKTGLVTVENGSTTITGDASADWAQARAGCLFYVVGRPQMYLINSVTYNPPVGAADGYWTAVLATPYGEADATDVTYTIVRDFTANYNLPLLSAGDVETASVVSRAFALLDAAVKAASLSGGVGGGEETPYTQASHGFVVGTCVCVQDNTPSAPTFVVADSAVTAKTRVVGMVKSVDGSDFVLQTDGYITGLVATLAPGKVYYLKASPSGAADTLTSNLAETVSQIPVLVAMSDHAGIFIGVTASNVPVMTGASTGVAGAAGAVPAPSAGSVLRAFHADGNYKFVLPADDTLLLKHLYNGGSFALADWDTLPGTSSPVKALVNLHTRLSLAESALGRVLEFTEPGTHYWVSPVSKTITITCVGGGGAGGGLMVRPLGTSPTSNAGNIAWGSGGGGGEVIRARLAVVAGVGYMITVGRGGLITGWYQKNASSFRNGGNSVFASADALTSYIVAKGGGEGYPYFHFDGGSAGDIAGNGTTTGGAAGSGGSVSSGATITAMPNGDAGQQSGAAGAVYASSVPGAGGNSYFGAGGRSNRATYGGKNGNGYGAGGEGQGLLDTQPRVVSIPYHAVATSPDWDIMYAPVMFAGAGAHGLVRLEL